MIGEPEHGRVSSREFTGGEVMSVAENTYGLEKAESMLRIWTPTVDKKANEERHPVCNLTPTFSCERSNKASAASDQ